MRAHQRFALLAAGVLVASFAITGTTQQAAVADPYGTCTTDTGCKPNDKQHAYCYDASMGSSLRSAFGIAMSNLSNQAGYWVTYAACIDSTDLHAYQVVISSTVRGDYLCLAKDQLGQCVRARIRLNPNLLTNTTNRVKTACHEIGHSGGLTHGGTTDCMRSGAVTSGYTTYNSHHVNHLNYRQ
jgi:hypothetical protein